MRAWIRARSDSRLANQAATLAEMASTTRPTIAAARNCPKRFARSVRSVDQRLLRLGQADALGHQCPRLGERLAPWQQEVAAPPFPLPRPHGGRKARMRPQVFAILLAQVRTRGQCSSSASCATETTG